MQGGRLPFIAPKQQSSSRQPAFASSSKPSPEKKGSRIPPRSKSGCWTCRTRKVKCDESRPSCGQCLRLGYTCDYIPRVAFKDDTPRILGRTQQVSTTGSYVWDPNVQDQEPKAQLAEDNLPPFSTLTTDDERERKAKSRDPGTFVVVANLTSFSDLPEYRAEVSGNTRGASAYSECEDGNYAQSSLSASVVGESEDPNPKVVILKVFEAPCRKPPTPGLVQLSATPFSPSTSRAISFGQQSPGERDTCASSNALSLLDTARQGGKNADLLRHYRTKISPQIIRISKSLEDEDIFETQARQYPPLFHAMMALSALSIAHKTGSPNANALEQYQQVIPALQATVQSSQDSYSDGALLTHLVLLLYEIAARESHMWQHHCDQLLRIILVRRQARSVDHFDFVIWMVYCIDVYASLSTYGTGTFAEVVVKQNMLPSPERCLLPAMAGQSQAIYPEEQTYFPTLININQETILIALQVGQLSKTLRVEADQRQLRGTNLNKELILDRVNRIQSLQGLVLDSRTKWKSQYPDNWTCLGRPDSLPPRVLESIEHSYLLFRVCILYTHTSMYSGQLNHPEPDTEAQINTCCTEILSAISIILSRERFDMRFIILPLFMAGFCTPNQAEKGTAIRFMMEVEKHGYGGSTDNVRRLLQSIYEKQRVAVIQMGNATSVDWVDEMERSGQRLIIYGL